MRVLVDEGMPVQVLAPLRLNKGHEFDHVDELRWKGKKDVPLFRDAAAKGYAAVLTLDLAQLDSAEESRALKRSGLHHVGIAQGRSAQGIKGIARVIS
jgi:predicted nuclease of predicted toxin-antitoxin system